MSTASRARPRAGLFSGVFGFEPEKLRSVVNTFAEQEMGLPADGREALDAVVEFLRDAGALSPEPFRRRWTGRRRALRRVLWGAVWLGRNRDPRLDRLMTALTPILEKAWHRRFLNPLGALAFHAPAKAGLDDLFLEKIRDYEGTQEPMVIWKRLGPALFHPRKTLEVMDENSWSPAQFLEKTALWPSPLGRRHVVALAQDLVRAKREGEFWEELVADGDGLLEMLTPEELAPFVNLYCGRYGVNQPDPQDRVFRFLQEPRVLGNHYSAAWMVEPISEHARTVFRRWQLAKDFHLIFDRILEHEERKQYWVRWLDQIEDIQAWCRSSATVNQKLGLAFRAQELDQPTLAMKIANCLIFECGRQGAGAIYVYPLDGPIKWPVRIREANDYKKILNWADNPPRNWIRVNHSYYWERRIDEYLHTYYRLARRS